MLTYDPEIYVGLDRPVDAVGRAADVDPAVHPGDVPEDQTHALPLLLAGRKHLILEKMHFWLKELKKNYIHSSSCQTVIILSQLFLLP